jgi:hypothetical protein
LLLLHLGSYVWGKYITYVPKVLSLLWKLHDESIISRLTSFYLYELLDLRYVCISHVPNAIIYLMVDQKAAWKIDKDHSHFFLLHRFYTLQWLISCGLYALMGFQYYMYLE